MELYVYFEVAKLLIAWYLLFGTVSILIFQKSLYNDAFCEAHWNGDNALKIRRDYERRFWYYTIIDIIKWPKNRLYLVSLDYVKEIIEGKFNIKI